MSGLLSRRPVEIHSWRCNRSKPQQRSKRTRSLHRENSRSRSSACYGMVTPNEGWASQRVAPRHASVEFAIGFRHEVNATPDQCQCMALSPRARASVAILSRRIDIKLVNANSHKRWRAVLGLTTFTTRGASGQAPLLLGVAAGRLCSLPSARFQRSPRAG